MSSHEFVRLIAKESTRFDVGHYMRKLRFYRTCIDTTNRFCGSPALLVFCKWLLQWRSLPTPDLVEKH